MTQTKATYHHGDLAAALREGVRARLKDTSPEKIVMRELTSALSVTPMAAYSHYKNKQAILDAVAFDGFVELKDALEQAILNSDGSPDEELSAIGVTYIAHGLQEPGLYLLMFDSMQSDNAPQALKAAADSAYDVLRQTLKKHAKHFNYSDEQAEGYAFTSWSMVHGMTSLFTEGHIRTKVFKTADQRSSIARQSVSLLVRGIDNRRVKM